MDKIKSSVAVKVTALVLSLLLVLSIVPVNGLTNSLRNSVSAAETPLANQATPDEVTVSEPDLPEPERKAITNIKGSLVISGSADCELISTRNDGNNVPRDIFSGLKDIKFICSEPLSDTTSVTLNTQVLTNDDSKDIYFKIDGSVLKIIFNKIADGTYPLTIKNGSGSKASYYNFFVDSTAPTAEIKYDKTVSDSAIKVTVYPNDNAGHSGYSDVDYDKTSVKFVNSGETELVPHNHKEGENSFTFSVENSGQYNIELSDKVGNKAEIAIPDKFIIDKTAPTVTILPDNSDESYKNNTWTNKDVKVAFSVYDGEYSSGVDAANIKVISEVTKKEYEVTKDEKTAGVYYFTADTYGKYTIKATDNAGRTGSVTSETVKIDKSETADMEVWFTKDNGILNFLTFGIYESSDVKVSVKAYYGNDESKIKDLKLYNNESEISDNSGSKGSDKNGNFIQKSFTISSAEKNKAYNLSFYIEDEAGNKTKENIPITNDKVKVYVHGVKKEINRNLFEVVFSESVPEIETVDVKADKVVKNEENYFYSGAITFKSKVQDGLSGLKDVKLYFNKASEIETDKDGNITNLSKLTLVEPANKIDISKTEKTTAIDDVSYTTPNNLATGEYTFVIAATNNNGKTSIKSTTVLVDRTQPEITKFEYSAKDTDKLKLEGGKLYCDKPVTVKVYADDLNIGGKMVVSSGLKDIKLYNGNDEITATSEFDSENGCKIFELPDADAPYDLSAIAIDNLGNGGEENAPKTTAKSLKKLTLNGEILDIDDNFKIVVNNNSLNIERSDFEFNGFSYSDENDVYSGDGTVSATITDKLSGISKVTVTVNDANVDGFCTVTDVENGKKVVFDTKKYNPNGIPDGKYTLKVTAENNCGINRPFDATFYMDNSNPEIKSFRVESAETSIDEIISFLTFGIYSNKDINVIVSAVDEAPSSNFKDLVLVSKNGQECEFVNESVEGDFKNGFTVTKTFRINNGAEDATKSVYNLSATVTDKAEHFDTKSVNDLGGYINANGEKVSVDGNFEIVSTDIKPEGITNYSTESSNDSINKNIVNGKEWYSGDFIVNAEIKDTISGIKKVKVFFNGDDVSDKITLSEDKFTESKITQAELTLDTKSNCTLKEGENKIRIEVYGNSNNCSFVEKSVYVDREASQITGFEFKKSVADQILSFLTFGIYSNNDVDVTVTAVDNKPSSGIDSIELSKTSGLEIVDESRIEYTNTSPEECTYVKTFTLKVDEAEFSKSESFYNDLTATVTDKVGNVGSSNYNNDGKPEVVITKKAPEITKSYDNLLDSDSAEWTSKYYDEEHNNYWFAGDVKFSFEVKDDYSKISSVQLMLNGTDVTECCTDTASDTPGKYTEIDTVDETGKEVSATTISIDTAKIPDEILKLEEGENIFTITATGNNGVTCDAEEVKFNIDTTKPQIDDFKFEPVGNMDEITTPVETTDYGYYFSNDVNVTVIASDGVGSGIGGSNNQVSSGIYYRCVDVDGSETNGIVLPGESFTVKKDFKGQIYAYAIDNVGNKCSEQHPYGSIVESEQKHRESSNIDLETVGTVVNKDDANRNLYNNDVKITIALKDSYSGIRTVHYRIYDDYGDNIENTFSIDQSGNFSDTYGWSYTKDKNLVTELKTTVPVAFNSNNIRGYVEFTDRAGHKESEDIIPFSIDKTAPTIKVVYDNNDFKTYQGNKYFKADRTATITVTERNFNEADFRTDIKKAPNSNAGIDGWTHNYNSANPDASTHVAHIRFTSDDDYTVDMAFKDMAQNRAESPAQEKFTLDKTLPKISVSFDNNSSLNGSYYKAERTATITIEEHNFASDTEHLNINFNAYDEDNTTPVSAPNVVGWTSNGDTRTATVTFADDGKYEFTVDYKDLAYNQAEQVKVDTFFVDKKNPEIKFENVEANAAYADSISPVVVFTDNNYDGYTTLTLERIDINSKSKIVNMNKTSVLNGVTGETVTYDNFGTIEENDGIYKLSAKMVDKAGNEKSREIIFSVNRFGSTYLAGDENTESLISSGYSNKESDVFIKEINVNKVSKQSVSLACNNSSVSQLKADENYTVSSNGGSGSWFEYTYKINKDNFADEGYYTITLSSTDRVKHTVSNITALTKERKCPVSFTIDKTVPEVRISGIEDKKPYEEASRQVKVVCEDVNISEDTLVIELNGKKLEAGEDKDFVLSKDNAGEIIAKFKVEAIGNDTKQNIKVSVADKAGNEGKSSVSDFILSASLLTRFFANTTLVIATFAAIAVIIGLVLFFVIRRRKKNEEK